MKTSTPCRRSVPLWLRLGALGAITLPARLPKRQASYSKGTLLFHACGCLLTAFAATAQPRFEARLGPGLVSDGLWPQVKGYATDVKVVGRYAYVTLALGDGGLEVIDVSDPANCVRVGGYATGRDTRGVAVAGNYAYVADQSSCLEVIDVSNPTHCVRVGGYDTAGAAQSVAVAGKYAYVADSEDRKSVV